MRDFISLEIIRFQIAVDILALVVSDLRKS